MHFWHIRHPTAPSACQNPMDPWNHVLLDTPPLNASRPIRVIIVTKKRTYSRPFPFPRAKLKLVRRALSTRPVFLLTTWLVVFSRSYMFGSGAIRSCRTATRSDIVSSPPEPRNRSCINVSTPPPSFFGCVQEDEELFFLPIGRAFIYGVSRGRGGGWAWRAKFFRPPMKLLYPNKSGTYRLVQALDVCVRCDLNRSTPW